MSGFYATSATHYAVGHLIPGSQISSHIFPDTGREKSRATPDIVSRFRGFPRSKTRSRFAQN